LRPADEISAPQLLRSPHHRRDAADLKRGVKTRARNNRAV
jgi:hypothetical protein